MTSIRRVYVEKKEAFAVEAQGLWADLAHNLLIKNLQSVRILARYDVMGLSAAEFKQALTLILSEPPVDKVLTTLKPAKDEHVFAVELLPGQYDQREDFAEQCIQLITQKEKPVVAAAKVYVLKGKLSKADIAKIKHYCINPVEAREAALELPKTLEETLTEPGAVAKMTGF
jgi:phosphoribosylformylglycinamidine synthase